ncbi:ChaN family lipoprotein [Undibacterium sp. LX40W]|uniref:ChaN family lipoprotein n=1 Tax=Undibacterium nitidum TaxID=2762298 RepID=A0A923HP28_9BURK|nr:MULTISPECIES: ChaN family lipoprotein [Undibacterium]MBC3879862.1 ChaN family lipoprotein [Undibacterium nitidum]MBC3891402.1 ChaN family lipoprotein [Undibacterium sp. LX40W]
MFSVCSRLAFALLLGLLVPASTNAEEKNQTHPLQDQIVDKQGQTLTRELVAEKIRRHAYVFVGEKHDNPRHHQLELDILRIRFSGVEQGKGSAVFEMLDDAQDTFIAQLKREQSLDEMKQVMQWPNKGWDWNSYGPLFRESVQFDALKSGNISRSMISTIYKDGQKILTSTPKLFSATKQSTETQNYLLDQIFGSHCGMQSRDTLQPMLHIQLAKDASMASAMASDARAILIAGGEHVRPNTGAPTHLKTLLPNADILVIQLVEVKADKLKLNDYLPAVGAADLYWFTEATPEQDYCSGVKGRAAQ